MHTHLRALALFFAVVFALSLGSCSTNDLFGWLGGDKKTEEAPVYHPSRCDEYAKSEAVDSLFSYTGWNWVPDSLLRDSVQYPYVMRYPTSSGIIEEEWVFATANGRWYGQTPSERQWGRYSDWFKVVNRLALWSSMDSVSREEGRKLIEENDGFIYEETNSYSDTTIYVFSFRFACPNGFYLRSEVPFIEFLDRYNQYPERFFVRVPVPVKKY